MALVTIDVDEAFIERLAEAIAVRSLAQAGMLPPDFDGPVASPAPTPVPGAVPAAAGSPADPWRVPAAPELPPLVPGTTTFRQSAPALPGPAAAAPNVVTIQTRSGAQTWTFDAPGAPLCQHGEAAGFVRGTNKDGKPYSAYRCAKGAGSDWRSKCEFNQWT